VVNRAFATFGPLSSKQFDSFVEPLAGRHPYLSAFAFLRMVPQAQRSAYEAQMQAVYPGFAVSELVDGKLVGAPVRDRYLVVEYLEPDEFSVVRPGYDVLSTHYLDTALERAAETGLALAAPLFRFGPPSLPRFVIVKAVYRPGAPLATPEERRAAVQGYTASGMASTKLIERILDASGMLGTPGLETSVYTGVGSADAVAYHTPRQAPPQSEAGWWRWSGAGSQRQLSQSFELAGLAWRVDVHGDADLAAEPQPGSWLVALFGVSISLMAAFYLKALGSQTQRIHKLVAERTAALYTANARLNADILARQRMEGALRRTEYSLRNAQRIAHVGSWETDIASGTHRWSDECFRIFGLAPEPDGILAMELLPPATRDIWRNYLADVLSGGSEGQECSIVRPDGSVRCVMLHAALASDAGIGAHTVIGSVLDITEFKRVETELRKSRASLRELGGHQERIKENERKRIAREIHDELGGLLTGIRAYVSVARSRAGEGSAVAPLLAEAMAQADIAIDTVRRVIADLRPSVLDQLGVWAAIEWQAGQLEAQTGVQCHCVIEPDLPVVGPDSGVMLFRIVQEALTNVARHARATSVEIRAGWDGDVLLLEIEDNGIGIALNGLCERPSWGLRGMHERAHHLGGSLALTIAANGGTLVSLRFPPPMKLSEVVLQ
jgi:PAS domain S-box-containing protein